MKRWWRDDPIGLRAIPAAAWFVVVSLWRAVTGRLER